MTADLTEQPGVPESLPEAGTAVALAAVWPALSELVGPFYVADAQGRLLYANAGFRDLLLRVVTDDAATLPAQLVRRVAAQPGGVRETQRLDGPPPRVFEGRHQPVAGADGAVQYLIGSYTEITRAQDALAAVRRLRAQHDEVLSTVSDWVWEIDADWRFRRSSTRSDEVLGFEPTFLLARDFFEVGEVLANPRVPGLRPPNKRRRAPFEHVLYRLETADTGERLFELSAIPKFDEETGAFTGFQGSARDVTQEIAADRRARDYRAELERALAGLKTKNAELDDALARARAADQAKNEFLAMVGHELRTPLNAVIGFAQLMDDATFGPLGNERYDAYVDDILSSSKHLLGVINDIIDVVKLELNEIRLQYDEIGVPQLLETCLSFVREKARKEGIHLTVEAGEAVPKLIADPQKARQMLVNLLSNAVKFTGAGGRIAVTARAADGWIYLAVADTGIGIPADRQESIMQPFQQADASLSRSYDGLGLGLPLTRRLAEAHGGALELDSVEGEGTTVTVVLPLEPPDA